MPPESGEQRRDSRWLEERDFLGSHGMYAVIKTGGKQYRVNEGDILRVEKLDGDVGGKISLEVLMLGGGTEGQDIKVGRPLVAGATVEAEITGQGRHPKVIHFHKRKEGYTYKRGHRQPFTELTIKAIQG
jgi:large subunit ribosomal protein L21